MKKLFTIIITAALFFGFSANASCGIIDENSNVPLAEIQLKKHHNPDLEAKFGPRPTEQFAGLIISATKKHNKNFTLSQIKWDEAYCTDKALIEDDGKVAIGWAVPYYGFDGTSPLDHFQQWWAIFRDNVLVAIHSTSGNELNGHSTSFLIMAKNVKYSPKGMTYWVRDEKAVSENK